jgi:hypothetical protein
VLGNGIFFELEKKNGSSFFVLRTPFSGFCQSFDNQDSLQHSRQKQLNQHKYT